MISDKEKHWLYVGLALNKTLVPELLPLLGKEVGAEYQSLKGPPHHIDTQAPAGRLTKWPSTARQFLNYENINGNDGHRLSRRRYDYSKFTYQVTSDVDFAKLFLQPHMAKFSKFAECDASAVLNLLTSVPAFSPATQAAAAAVRDNVRNQWAHCRFKEWDAVKFADCFKEMEHLITSFKFAAAKEKQLLGKVKEWESKGGAMIAESLVDLSLITLAMKEIALLKKEFTSLDADYKERISNLNDLSMKLSELEETVKQHDLQIRSMNERMDTKDAELGSLKRRMDTKDAELGSLKRRMDTKDVEVRSLDVEMGSLKRRMDNVETGCMPQKQLCTENSVKNFTSKMKDQILQTTELENKLLNSPDIFPVKVDDIYTNMVIQMGRKKDEFCGKKRSEILSSYPEHSNVPIERVEELFLSMADTEDPRRILIRGRAGIGKTLFCQMLARDWAKERLFREVKNKGKFQFVFLFTFRHLNSIDKPLTLYEFLRCSHTCPDMRNDIYEFIISNPEKTLLIFDGFDEFRYQQEMRHERVNIDGQKMTIGTLVAKLTAGELLSTSTVIITSRPEAESNLYKLKIQRGVEMLGFNKDHVKKYVGKFFTRINSDRSQIVLDYILKNENVATLCYVPVNCFLVCSYMKWYLNDNEGAGSASFPTTIAELFLEVIRMFLLKHHKECRGEDNPHLSDTAKKALDKLCQLSFELLKSKTFLFSDEDLENYGIQKEEIDPLLSSGLLHCIPGWITGPFSTKTYYCFLHLTLQEFLAACCLIRSGELIRLQRNATEDFPDLSKMVFVFVAGLLGRFVKECGDNVFRLKVTKENANKIMSWLTEKARDKSQLVRLLYGYKEKQFVQNFLRESDLSWLELSSVDSIMCQAVAFLLMTQVEAEHQVKYLTLDCDQNTDCRYIVEALKCEFCQLKCLGIRDGKLSDEDIQRISHALTSPKCHLTELILVDDQISDKGAEHFSHALTSPNCHLTTLCLDSNKISDKGAEHFSHALTSPSCHLTELHLDDNKISDKGAERFSHALTSPNCHLTVLYLDSNQISDKGAEYFSHALTRPNCHLTELHLNWNKISDKGAEHFNHGLTSPNCHLTKLYLVGNQISDKGAEHFSHALTSPNCHLTKLYLVGNQISDKGAEHFSHALTSPNCHLTELHLDDNKISDEGAEHFSHALISPNCHLTELYLGGNQISDKGAEQFSHALTCPNCHLTVLHLDDNQISDRGLSSLRCQTATSV